MRQHPPEGLPVGLVAECQLASSGLLTGGGGLWAAKNLTAEAVELFVLVASAGPEGLHRSRVPRLWLKDPALALLPLELENLVAWEHDNRGRPSYLALTWKGEDALKAMRNARPSPRKLHQARLRALELG